MTADIRACSRHLATVVAVRGDICAADVDAGVTRVLRLVLPDTSFVLDLSGVTSIAAEATALLAAVDDACARAGVEWALVSAAPVLALFDEDLRDRLLPVVDSVADALHDFADAMADRRSALLPLLQRTA
jgi:anti-anti-sigma regulatory factor